MIIEGWGRRFNDLMRPKTAEPTGRSEVTFMALIIGTADENSALTGTSSSDEM